jgi:hypothetical protein
MGAQHADNRERLARLEADLERLTNRLRGLSTLAWSSRRGPVLNSLRQWVETATRLDGHALRAVPAIEDHALGDAVAVVGRDTLDALRRSQDSAELQRTETVFHKLMDATR